MGLRLRPLTVPLVFALITPAVSAEPAPFVRLLEVGSTPLASAPHLLLPPTLHRAAEPTRNAGPIDAFLALASRFN